MERNYFSTKTPAGSSNATADQSPKNLALQVSGRQGRILVFGCRFAHVCQIHFLDHDFLILQNGIAEPNVEVTKCAHNAIALQINGMFLSADSDGLVRADRNWCRDWELYTLFAIPCAPLTNLFGLSGTKSVNGALSLDLQSKPQKPTCSANLELRRRSRVSRSRAFLIEAQV